MSKVDRASKTQERTRRALQRISNDPHGSLDIDEAGPVAMFFSSAAASGKNILSGAQRAALFSLAAPKYNDTAIRSRSWMGV